MKPQCNDSAMFLKAQLLHCFAPQDIDHAQRVIHIFCDPVPREAIGDFFGGISTVVDYCAAAEKSFTPRKEFLEQLQGQYGLKAAAADWVLNSVISMGMSLNPDTKAVDNLRTNFEQQGGRVL